ncbi:MAG TPA: hypothetical protein VKB88_46335 [Bryobacteraceae bacterium]|nr:hypothetical protein [Bryobacteraceae bacterium]
MSRLKRNRGFTAALRARGHGFRLGETSAASASSFLLACFAALRLVLEVLVVEEMLFSRCEDEIGSTVYAFEDAVLKLRHSNVPVIDLEYLSDICDGGVSGSAIAVTRFPGDSSSGFVYGPALA